jgi:hypothetical protein
MPIEREFGAESALQRNSTPHRAALLRNVTDLCDSTRTESDGFLRGSADHLLTNSVVRAGIMGAWRARTVSMISALSIPCR